MTEFRPSPAMMHAVTESLAILKRHFARQMPLALEPTHEGNQFTEDFARALNGLDPQFVLAAAQKWLSLDEAFAPRPGELRALALQLQRAASPLEKSTYAGPVTPVDAPHMTRGGNIILRLRHATYPDGREFGWATAMRVWNQMLATATHPDTRRAWEDGLIPEYKVDDAIESEVNRVEELRQQHHVEPIEPASTFREWCSSKAIPHAKQRA